MIFDKNASPFEKGRQLARICADEHAIVPAISFFMDALESEIHLDGQDLQSGKTALTALIYRGLPTIAGLVVDKGANVNIMDRLQQTPLCLAAYKGYAPLCSLLVSKGADLDTRGYNGDTALLNAIKQKHAGTALALIEAGADIYLSDEKGYGPMFWASMNDLTDVALKLLEKDIALKDAFKDDPKVLETVTSLEREAIALKILCRTSAVDIPDKTTGQTYLMRAVLQSTWPVCAALIDKGAAIDAVDNSGYTPVGLCLMRKPERAAALIRHDKKLDANSAFYKSLILDIRALEHADLIEALLEKGVSSHGNDDRGKSPIILAAECGYVDSVMRFAKTARLEDLIAARALIHHRDDPFFKAEIDAFIYQRQDWVDQGMPAKKNIAVVKRLKLKV